MPEQRYIVFVELLSNGKWLAYKPSETAIFTFYPAEQVWEFKKGTKVIFRSESSEFWSFDGNEDFYQFIFRDASNSATKARLNLDEKAYDLYEAANEQDTPVQFYFTPPATAPATGQGTETGSGNCSNAGLIIGLLAMAGIGLYMASKSNKKSDKK